MIVNLVTSFRRPLKAGYALLIKRLEEDAKNQAATKAGRLRSQNASEEAAAVAAECQRVDVAVADEVSFDEQQCDTAGRALEIFIRNERACVGTLKSLGKDEIGAQLFDEAQRLEETLLPVFRGGQGSLELAGGKTGKGRGKKKDADDEEREEEAGKPPLMSAGQRPAAAGADSEVLDEPPARPTRETMKLVKNAADTGA
jgi:hypothetical protein